MVAAKKQGLTDYIPKVMIHPSIDVDYFNIKGKKWKKFNGKEKIHFLTVARLHWKKGLDYTLQALAVLKEKNILFQYTIIGEGQERERLLFTIHQLGLEDRITFVGSVPHQDIIKYYESADIYLQYSIQEGFCNAVLEAQAMGLITIVSNAEGLSENVLHGKTGWVVPKRKPILLAENIEHILAMDNENRIQVQKNAMVRIKNEFSLKKQIRKFSEFFQ